ncbi:hypothetical protein AB0K09_20620 [Streptomyces sp. NPDC049577]|uniref:hypothetical protein n=1 Tax=Streptomyces sp. NPDC049577 TaxID=3155153 RepID=UPI003432C698
MIASDKLLDRIAGDPFLSGFLACPGDFDITCRNPVEDLSLPTGIPLRPIAGCGAGGTYFLCGGTDSAYQPVLYADSEGRATLIGGDLAEALTLITTVPYWRDLGTDFPITDLAADLRADHPTLDADRARFLAALGLPSPSEPEAITRLLAVAASTAPDYVPAVPDDDHVPYDLFFGAPFRPGHATAPGAPHLSANLSRR